MTTKRHVLPTQEFCFGAPRRVDFSTPLSRLMKNGFALITQAEKGSGWAAVSRQNRPQSRIFTAIRWCSAWWNTKGLVHFELLNSSQKITTQLYSQKLNRVCPALRRKEWIRPRQNFFNLRALISRRSLSTKSRNWARNSCLIRHVVQTWLHLTTICSGRCSISWRRKKFKNSEKVQNLGVHLFRLATCRLLCGWHPFFAW